MKRLRSMVSQQTVEMSEISLEVQKKSKRALWFWKILKNSTQRCLQRMRRRRRKLKKISVAKMTSKQWNRWPRNIKMSWSFKHCPLGTMVARLLKFRSMALSFTSREIEMAKIGACISPSLTSRMAPFGLPKYLTRTSHLIASITSSGSAFRKATSLPLPVKMIANANYPTTPNNGSRTWAQKRSGTWNSDKASHSSAPAGEGMQSKRERHTAKKKSGSRKCWPSTLDWFIPTVNSLIFRIRTQRALLCLPLIKTNRDIDYGFVLNEFYKSINV